MISEEPDADELRRAKNAEYHRKWRQSEKGKASLNKTRQSASCKASVKKYRQSAKGKKAIRKYNRSAKAKAARRKYQERVRAEKLRDYDRRLYETRLRAVLDDSQS